MSRPREVGGQINLHGLHRREARLAQAPVCAVVSMPGGFAVGLQQAKLRAGRSRRGELQVVPGRAGERRRITKVSRTDGQSHLSALAKVRADEHRAKRLGVRVGELENAPLAKLDRAVAPRVAQFALGPLASFRVENGHLGALGCALKQRGDGLIAAQRQRHMIERLARRDVEIDIAHAVKRMTGETARGQLIRHQHAHKLFLHTSVVGHWDAHQPVLVLVIDELVPANPVGGALYFAVRTRLAR